MNKEDTRGNVSSRGNDVIRFWCKEVDLPTFDGNDLLRWIVKGKKFFEILQIETSKTMQLTFANMEGIAVVGFIS